MVTLHDIGVVLVTIGVACIFVAAGHWVVGVFAGVMVPAYLPHHDDRSL